MINLELFWLIALAALYLGAVILSWLKFGPKVAMIVATIGIAHLLYRKGKTDGKKDYVEKAEEVNKKREAEYDKIDNRNTTRDDVIDRLQHDRY